MKTYVIEAIQGLSNHKSLNRFTTFEDQNIEVQTNRIKPELWKISLLKFMNTIQKGFVSYVTKLVRLKCLQKGMKSKNS